MKAVLELWKKTMKVCGMPGLFELSKLASDIILDEKMVSLRYWKNTMHRATPDQML